VTDVKVTSSFLKRLSIRLRICISLRWQQTQDLNRNVAMSTWRSVTGNHRNNADAGMNEIIWEPADTSFPVPLYEDNIKIVRFVKRQTGQIGGGWWWLSYKLWRNSNSRTPEVCSFLIWTNKTVTVRDITSVSRIYFIFFAIYKQQNKTT